MTTTPSNFARTRSALRFTQFVSGGNTFFVSSGSGSATGGYTADAPAATLAQALALCTDDAGDTIFVLPGHAETVHVAAYITLSQKGVTIIGLGNGTDRPLFTWDATASQIIVSGINTTFRNLRFNFAGVDQVVAAFSVTAADVAFEDCEFLIDNATNMSVILGILTAATATRFRVERCRFLGTAAATATVTACIKHEVGTDFVIRNNFFVGKLTQAVLNATTILRGLIADNYAHIYTGTKAFALASGTTGVGFNNRIIVPSGTAPIVGAGFSWTGNIYGTEALTIGTPTAAPF